MPISRPAWLAWLAFLAFLAFLAWWPLACANTPNNVRPPPIDASHPVDRPLVTDGSGRSDLVLHDASGPQCKWPTALDNDGVPGCVPTRAFVTCTETGGSASYPASDPMGCVSCSGTCRDSCALNELALSCNVPQPDAAASAGPTQGCHPAFTLPLGGEVYCCPCQ